MNEELARFLVAVFRGRAHEPDGVWTYYSTDQRLEAAKIIAAECDTGSMLERALEFEFAPAADKIALGSTPESKL